MCSKARQPEGNLKPNVALTHTIIVLCLQKFEMALRLASFANILGQPETLATYHISVLFAFDLFNTRRSFDIAFQYFYKLKTDPILVLGLCGGDIYKEELASKYPSTPVVSRIALSL